MSSPAELDPARMEALSALCARRALLATGLGGIAAIATKQGAQAASSGGAGSLASAATHLPVPELYTLVQRTSQGYSLELWNEATTRGYAGYLEWQLDAASIPDGALDARLLAYPSLGMTSRQLQDAYVIPGQPETPASELRAACLVRSIQSKRQLFERMVEFWTDHFNIDHAADECRVLKTTDDRDVIRAHALGTFPDLLRASAHSGAMLFYLDNYSNQAAGVNENYARELLELHTLSPGNYTETDVRQLAQVLTGWTIWRPNDPAYGTFRFRRDWHANGTYTVLGRTYGPNGGQADGEAVLDHLAVHPVTASFIAKKLCRWLLAYDPPKPIVDRVAREYLRTGGDIRSLIRVALRPEHLAQSAAATRPKLKRPFTFLVSLLRATNSAVASPDALLDELDAMGQLPFVWGAPDGYPDSTKYWGKSILPRWSFASRLFAGAVPGVTTHVGGAFQGLPAAKAGERCSQIFGGGNFTPEEVAALAAYATSFPAFTLAVQREVLALAASCPSFQVY